MIRPAIPRGAAWPALVTILGLAITGCAAQSGGQAYYSGSSYAPYGNIATQSSTCGALGTCAPSNYPRVVPGDEHGD